MWSEHKGGPGNLYLIGDKARQRAEHIPRSAQLARKRSFCRAMKQVFCTCRGGIKASMAVFALSLTKIHGVWRSDFFMPDGLAYVRNGGI